MSANSVGGVLTPEEIEQFHQVGYLIKRALFAREAPVMAEHFMDLQSKGPIPDCFEPVSVEQSAGDILRQYPRMMHPHKVDAYSMDLMLDQRVIDVLADLFAEEPLAMQSMFYFKPPGAKGQALHQDNYYLRVSPGTCIAAWTAVDGADETNGGLFVVPNTQNFAVLCPDKADLSQSFTTDYVAVPDGYEAVPIQLQAGDVLFFNGSLIHGSYPNHSADRFRRAFICHYAGISSESVSDWYKPIYRYNGEVVDVATNEAGGPCGTEASVVHGA